MKVRRLKSFTEIGSDRWNALCAGSGTNTIFQTYEWHSAWWDAYGAGRELFLLVVEDDGRLLGIAPMMLTHHGHGRKALVFIGDFRSDYLDFIYDAERPEVLNAFMAFLASSPCDWDTITLSEVPEGSPTHKGLAPAVKESHLYCGIVRKRQCPTLVIKGNETQANRIINKKKLRYYKRYFEERPSYEVRHLAACEEIGCHLEGFFEQHVSRWAGTPTPSIFLEDESRLFYRNLVSSMCDKGWITLTVVESEGEPVAYHFGFVYGNVFVVYKPVYNPLFAKRSPGQVLIKELLEYAVARGYDEFDFTVGGEAYKHRFSSDVRHNTTYRILKSRRLLLTLRLRTWLKKSLERNAPGRRFLAFKKRLTRRHIPRLTETVETHGVLGWLTRAAGMLFRKFIFRYSHMVFFEMAPGAIADHPIEPKIDGVVFREATIADLVRFDFPRSPIAKQELLAIWIENLGEGTKCFMAEIDGEVAATMWIRMKDHAYISETETYVHLPDSPLCVYDAWTLPKYRGKRLLTFLYYKVLELYPEKRKIAYLYQSNIGSFRAVVALGNFRITRTYHLLNILGIKRRWSKPYKGPQPSL